MIEIELKIVQKEVGDKEANLDNISKTMLNRKNPFWPALERLFAATNRFTCSRKIFLNKNEFDALFLIYNSPTEAPSIQPSIASLRLAHYIAATFGETAKDITKEVIFITKHGKKIIPAVLVDDNCQRYDPPVFIGVSVEIYN